MTLADSGKNETETEGTITELGRIKHNATVGLAAVIIVLFLGFATYYSLKHIFSYLGAKAHEVSMSFPALNNETDVLRVGETITLKLVFMKIGQPSETETTPCGAAELENIATNLVPSFYYEQDEGGGGGRKVEVAVLKTFSATKDALLFRFSLRKAGNYSLSCAYWKYDFVGSPLDLKVDPTFISLRRVKLHLQNPETLPLTVDQWFIVPISVHDRYGNVCQIEEELIKQFGIIVKTRDLYTDCFPTFTWSFELQGSRFILRLNTSAVGVYKCLLTFNHKPIEHAPSHSNFMVISMKSEEEEEFRIGWNSYFTSVPGSLVKVELIFIGAERQDPPLEVWVSVSLKQIAISMVHMCGFSLFPFISFYISRRTKISLVGPYDFGARDENENEQINNVLLKISDGIQDSVTLGVSSAKARMFLATFGHFKGQKFTTSTFANKRSNLKTELSGILPNFLRRQHFMALDKSNLLASSMQNVPSAGTDWWKPFIVGSLIDIPPPPSITYWSKIKRFFGWNTTPSTWYIPSFLRHYPPTKPMCTKKWLSGLIEAIFSPEDQTCGLFIRHPESVRLHPNRGSNRSASWTLKEMEFAGSVVAKCVCDSMNFGLCVNLTQVRFTKSFLACLIGLPVTYQHFESDYPILYEKHVIPVLNNQGEDLQLNFETPANFEVDSHKNKIQILEKVALLPDGNNIPVMQRNKLHYLNLLALQILKNRYIEEIEAFRNGFYKVVPQGLVADFDVDELERLICGGGSSFNILDLKTHHRVVGDLLNHTGLSDTDLPQYNFSAVDQRKVLRWWWIILFNLSGDEEMRLLSLVTGSSALPTCGCAYLTPKFTISLTGGYNQKPKYHPSLHLVAIGNHDSFAKFEKNVISSLYEADEMGVVQLEEVQEIRRNSNSRLETEAGGNDIGEQSSPNPIVSFYRRITGFVRNIV